MANTKPTNNICECLCLSRCSQFVQNGLERIFSKIGNIVGNHPWKVIFSSIIITCLFALGFANWTTESRVTKLWIPQNTKAEEHSDWVSSIFNYEVRTEQILLRPNDNGNVLSAHYFQQYWIAYTLMVNTTAPATDGYQDQFPGLYSWDGYNGSTAICLQLGPSCKMNTVFDIVGYNYNDVYSLTDNLLMDIINDPNITIGIDLSSVLGGLEYNEYGEIVSAAVISGTYDVEANAIDENNNFIDPSRQQWELDVKNKIVDYPFEDSKVVPYFVEGFGEEFGNAIASDAGAYAIGCTLLIIYTSLALGKRDYIHSMIGLALCAVLTVGLAIMGSYGLAGALGIVYTPLSGSLPFLVLGLGVDDAFIIAGEFQQISRELGTSSSVTKRMEITMKHAGVSILITSLTDFVAFAIGSTTVLPALRAFCLYAAFGVFFVFILNVTFFAACVVLDSKRASLNRLDIFCCFKLKTLHPMFYEKNKDNDDDRTDNNTNSKLSYCCCIHKIPTEASRKLFKFIGESIMNLYVKITIITIATGILGLNIYCSSQLEQDFKIEWFLPDTSYLQDYYSWKNEYFNTGVPIWIYVKDIDYYEYSSELLECNYLLKNASYLTGFNYDWHSSFWKYINQNDIQINENNYYYLLISYLYSNSTNGGQYIGTIEWNNQYNPNDGIAGSYMFGLYTNDAVIDAESQVNSMYAIRDDVNDIVGNTPVNEDIFPFTYQMLFWEQFAVISEEFYRNLILAIIVVFFITLILIPNIFVALLVLLTVVCTIVDVLGFMWLWGLTIDAVTVCYTVIAIGLSVDYSAHIGEAFMLSSKQTKQMKVIDSLYRIGASVFNGAFSTFLAVVTMANSQTYIFRVFFRQFFLVTIIGSFHGLIVLPVLLSWFGPSTAATDKIKEEIEMENKQTTNNNNSAMDLKGNENENKK